MPGVLVMTHVRTVARVLVVRVLRLSYVRVVPSMCAVPGMFVHAPAFRL
jgi:hypothetical protein